MGICNGLVSTQGRSCDSNESDDYHSFMRFTVDPCEPRLDLLILCGFLSIHNLQGVIRFAKHSPQM
jgi:hypothetical protein